LWFHPHSTESARARFVGESLNNGVLLLADWIHRVASDFLEFIATDGTQATGSSRTVDPPITRNNMFDFQRGMPVIISELRPITATSTRIFSDLLLKCHGDIGRHLRAASSSSQGRKLVASPFSRAGHQALRKHVGNGFLIQFFKRSPCSAGVILRGAPFLPELVTVRFALNFQAPLATAEEPASLAFSGRQIPPMRSGIPPTGAAYSH